jgi:hypothetical protein
VQQHQYDGSLRIGSLYGQFAKGDQPPSTYAVTSWVRGERWGFSKTLGVTALRAATIVPGVWLGRRWFGDSTWGTAATVSISLTLAIAATKLVELARQPSAGDASMTNDLGRFRRPV